MAALKNTRHERFVQELAKGKTQIEAYTLAGYKPDDGNAATLFGKPDIQGRLAEMADRVAVKTELTATAITERLMRIADVAEKTGIKVDEDTCEATVSSAKHLSVARAALMDAAKLNGLVVDKAEVEHTGVILNVTPDDASL